MVGSINTGEGGSQVSCSKIWCGHSETSGIFETKGEQHNVGMRTDITQRKSNDNAETGISSFLPRCFGQHRCELNEMDYATPSIDWSEQVSPP